MRPRIRPCPRGSPPRRGVAPRRCFSKEGTEPTARGGQRERGVGRRGHPPQSNCGSRRRRNRDGVPSPKAESEKRTSSEGEFPTNTGLFFIGPQIWTIGRVSNQGRRGRTHRTLGSQRPVLQVRGLSRTPPKVAGTGQRRLDARVESLGTKGPPAPRRPTRRALPGGPGWAPRAAPAPFRSDRAAAPTWLQTGAPGRAPPPRSTERRGSPSRQP